MSGLKWRKRGFYLLAVSAVAALAIACGNDAAEEPGGAAGGASSTVAANMPAEPSNKAQLATLKGDIVIDGSSTVYPVTQAAAEEFRQYAKDVKISVGIAGTGGGFKKFCANETDIQDASRPISTSEAKACADSKVEFIELPVAYDGLAVIANPKNTWATCLTKDELKKIWEPAAQGKITNWNQVRATFPDKPLKLFGAGTDSGTFDYFTEAIMGTAKSSRGDFQASEDDNVLVQGVAGDEGALGFFGFAYYQENQAKLKLLQVDNKADGKCVAPSIQTVNDGSYQPLSRPIFIYVKKAASTRPEVKAFVDFYLSKSFTPLVESREVGYVSLGDKAYEAIGKRFTAGTVGTLFPNGAEVGATLDRYTK